MFTLGEVYDRKRSDGENSVRERSERRGERGIRTPGDREASMVFKTIAIVRSAISPLMRILTIHSTRAG